MNSKQRKRKIADIVRMIVLFVAISVLLYPTVSNYLYERNSSTIISDYDKIVDTASIQERESMLAAARQYNEHLKMNQKAIVDGFIDHTIMDEEYESLLNHAGDGMMGYISIPKIKVLLPMYHGTMEKVLQIGTGHLMGTSLPVGGDSTHAVVTGHRGLPSKMLFTDLDQLIEGDIFYVKVLGETMAYQVDQILTVLPEETEALDIVEGQDYVTLLTCTPYAVNTHRLLVRGKRISYEEAVQKVPDTEVVPQLPYPVRLLILAFILLIIVFVGYEVRKILRRRKEETDR